MALAKHFPRLRRFSPLILVLAGLFIYFSWIGPGASEQRTVLLELRGPIGRMTRLDTVWTRIDIRTEEAVTGATYYFKEGQAPAQIGTRVHAPSGVYWLDVTVTRGSQQSTHRRRVTLDSSDVKVFLDLNDLTR